MDYYNNSLIGYWNYRDYPHFAQRAQWIYDMYVNNGMTGEVWVVGCGWGWVIKHLLELVPSAGASKIHGVVFSQYEYDQAINVVGLTDTNIELVDADTKTFPAMDICITWNFFDSLPVDDAKVQRIVDKFVANATVQAHVICVTDNDPDAQKYTDSGYNIQSGAYWADKFTNANTTAYFVEYATGKVWRKNPTWSTITGFDMPTSWGRVSD